MGDTARDRKTGRQFWAATVSLLDGCIEETVKHDDAKAGYYRHRAFLSPGAAEKFDAREVQMFWLEGSDVRSWFPHEPLPPDIREAVMNQIEIVPLNG